MDMGSLVLGAGARPSAGGLHQGQRWGKSAGSPGAAWDACPWFLMASDLPPKSWFHPRTGLLGGCSTRTSGIHLRTLPVAWRGHAARWGVGQGPRHTERPSPHAGLRPTEGSTRESGV